MQVGPAEAGDFEALAELLTEYFRSYSYELGDQDTTPEIENPLAAQPTWSWIVAKEHDEIIGVVALEPTGEFAKIRRIFVSPNARGRGVAQLLLDEFTKLAKSKNYASIILDTSEPMKRARKLYAKNGFKVWNPDYVAQCNDVVSMRKEI